jgi:type 1 glutamine amidotransferase
MTWNRREMLLAAGASLLGPGVLKPSRAAQTARKKILFFTKSSGFQHSVITRKNGKLSMAEENMNWICKEFGYEVVNSKDGRLFNPDKIGQWDAFVFETTGDLTTPGNHNDGEPISPEGEKALYDAIRGGKGFVGMHCATDTFGHHGKRNKGAEDPYIQMIGGEFIVHGAQQEVTLKVVDPDFPGARPFGSSFRLKDEWYALKNFAENLHVIIVQETKGMVGPMYQRPPFPETWARMYDKGRVFYTSMGHREDVWDNPFFQGLVIGALNWVTGRVDANVEPNLMKVTPGCDEIPPGR